MGFMGWWGTLMISPQALCDRYQAQMRPEDVFRKLETKILEIEIIEE